MTTTTTDAQPDLTLDEAKQHTIDQIEAFMAYIPAEDVVEKYPADRPMPLLSCKKDGYYQWPGAGDVTIPDGYDITPVMSRIEADFSEKPGWTISQETTVSGASYLSLLSPDLYIYDVGTYGPNSHTFHVGGASPCFPAPPNFDAARDY